MRPAPLRTVRLMIPGSMTAPLAVGLPRAIAITRDGARIVYVGVGGTLFVRSLDQLEPTPITGLSRAPSGTLIPINDVFLSPDAQWVGFSDSRCPPRT